MINGLKDVAIYYRSKNIGIKSLHACYISPNISIVTSDIKIDKITERIRENGFPR